MSDTAIKRHIITRCAALVQWATANPAQLYRWWQGQLQLPAWSSESQSKMLPFDLAMPVFALEGGPNFVNCRGIKRNPFKELTAIRRHGSLQ